MTYSYVDRRRREKDIGIFCFMLALLLTICSIIWIVARTVEYVRFDINCGGHLKRAADANTIGLAQEELQSALEYMEESGLTDGSTHVLWKTPATDIGFLYQNLSDANAELLYLPESTSSLERTNVLMKLRETILDEGQHVSVTLPEGISVYPSQRMYFWSAWILFPLTCVFWLAGFVFYGDW